MQTLKMSLLFVAFFLGLTAFNKVSPSKEGTNWISLAEAEKSFAKEKRPILIDLYTDWCGWCKVMDKKTYAHPKVAAYLSKNFYTVKFDAEGKSPVTFNNKTFRFSQQYRTHELAIALTQGNLSYPTTVIIPGDGSQPQVIPGYLEPKQFEKILKYFGEGKYGKVPLQEYDRNFKGEW